MTRTIEEEMKDSIERIRAKIVADYTFLTEFLPTEDIPDDTIKTIQTNGIQLKYNPKFLYSRNFKDRMFMYIHEVAHNFLGHPIRIRPEHNNDIAQVAADFVTNDLLDDAGLDLPKDALIDYKLRGMAYEEVYAILNQQPQHQQPQHDPGKRGTVQPQPKDQTKGDPHEQPSNDPHADDPNKAAQQLQAQLEKHEQKQLSAMQMGEMAGNVSADLQRRFNNLKTKPVNWKEALPTEIDQILGMEDYSYAVPNNNIDDDTFIYPGMVGEKVKPMALIVDTSISVSLEKLSMMARDVVGIVEQAEPEKILVLSVDAQLKNVQTFDGDDTNIAAQIDLKGGGGTDFRPGFIYLDTLNEDFGLAVYLTDGMCSYYPPAPSYPVVWLIYGSYKRFNPPFGTTIHME